MVRKSEFFYLVLLILTFCLAGNLFAGEIHEAAKTGDLEKIKEILTKDPSRLEAQDKVGYTALNWAAMRAQWEVVRFLVENNANVQIFGIDGNTPLHCAANHGNVAIIGFLIKKGAIVDKKNRWGNTPLHISSISGNRKVAKILIFQGAKVNALSNEGWTPLYYAQLSGHTEMAGQLKRQGASLEYLDSDGKNADEIRIRRPEAIDLDRADLDQYAGLYSFGDFAAKLWVEEDKLWLEHFSHHPTYPIGVDSFYCEKKPWTVSFTRNDNDGIDSIYLEFLRQTVGGVKVADDFKLEEIKPKLGLMSRSLAKTELSFSALKDIYRLDTHSDFVAASVTFVLENSPADYAGIKQRDIILMFNNDPVMNSDDLIKLVEAVEPGTIVPVEILRNGNVYNLSINFE